MSAATDRVLERLEGVVKVNGGHQARCPAHPDGKASLSIAEGEDGRALLCCHAGCSVPEIVAKIDLTMADLMAPKANGKGKLGELVCAYDYTDEDGTVLYQNCRFSPKDFRARRPDGKGGWVWGVAGVQRVLYHLPQLVAGVAVGERAYLCEGEKDVQAIEAAGGVATTKAFGANSEWLPSYSTYLRGASVTIVAHRDEPNEKGVRPGLECAMREAAALQGIAASVAIVQAASGCDRPGADAADHLAAGHTLDEFEPVSDGALVAARQADSGPAAAAAAGATSGAAGGDSGAALVCEAAHTAVLAAAWRDRYRWATHEGTWRRWDGRVWEELPEAVVVAAAQHVLRQHYARCLAEYQGADEDKRLRTLHAACCRHSSVVGGLAFLKGEPGFHTPFADWDRDPYLLNCADGMLDMRTQTLRPHDPAELCTRIVAWPYGSTDTSGAWQRHLELCLPNANVRRQVQRDLGRALVDAVLEESLPIWLGPGKNGKSTTERALTHGMARYGKRAAPGLLVASKYERHPTELADLAGTRLVFSEEIDDGKQLAEALVKDLTGGGRKKARFMRGDFFEFEQTFSIFLLVNHLPIITGTDTGIWRRISEIPWTVRSPPPIAAPKTRWWPSWWPTAHGCCAGWSRALPIGRPTTIGARPRCWRPLRRTAAIRTGWAGSLAIAVKRSRSHRWGSASCTTHMPRGAPPPARMRSAKSPSGNC